MSNAAQAYRPGSLVLLRGNGTPALRLTYLTLPYDETMTATWICKWCCQ